jgi:Fe-S cluster assembly protein SufD
VNAVAEAVERYRAEFERIDDRLAAGAAWLEELRRAAIDDFSARGFPGAREEAWKYTNLSRLARQTFVPADSTAAQAIDERLLAEARLSGSDELVFVNGHYHAGTSRRATAESAHIETLGENLDQQAIKERLENVAGGNVFRSLNSAFFTDAALLKIVGDHPRPIHLLFLSTSGDAPYASHPRVIIEAEANSRACVVETFVGPADSAYFTNVVTQVDLQPGARIEHYRLQREGAKAFHIGQLLVKCAADGLLTSHNLSLGAALARSDISIALQAAGANAVLNGLYLPTGKQHIDNHLSIDHAAADTASDILYKGVLDERGRAVFNGKVLVRPDAQKTEAKQTNKNLLLSAEAEADTKPELEIYADDVKCSHGATVGQLDADALFYLRSRGIDAREARGALTFAFIEEVLQRLSLDDIRERMEQAIIGELPLVSTL